MRTYICFLICPDELLYLFETPNAFDYRLGTLATAKNKSLAKPFPWIPILQTSTNRFATINKLSLFYAISTCRTGQSVCSDIFFLFFFRESQLTSPIIDLFCCPISDQCKCIKKTRFLKGFLTFMLLFFTSCFYFVLILNFTLVKNPLLGRFFKDF